MMHHVPVSSPFFKINIVAQARILRITSDDSTNRLTGACVIAISAAIDELKNQALPLIITGNSSYFSVGADLNEIRRLSGPSALEFARLGQSLMQSLENYPTPVIAAIGG